MADDNPSILSHVSVGTNDFTRAVGFYDKVLPTLGCQRIMEHPGAVAYGKVYPEFWVQTPLDGRPASLGNGLHMGFVAPTKEAVHVFLVLLQSFILKGIALLSCLRVWVGRRRRGLQRQSL